MTDRSSPGEEVRGNALTAFLATAEYVILQAPKGTEGASESLIGAGCWAAPRLFAAVQKVLAQHQPGRVLILGALCPAHEDYRYFSITSTEAANVGACQDCAATVHDSCAGCGPQVRLDSCPVRAIITRELLGKGE